MNTKETEALFKRVEEVVREGCLPFVGQTITEERMEEMARQVAMKLGPLVAEVLGPLVRSVRAVNLGQDKVEVTGELVLSAFDRIRDLARSGDVSPLLDQLDSMRTKP